MTNVNVNLTMHTQAFVSPIFTTLSACVFLPALVTFPCFPPPFSLSLSLSLLYMTLF